MKEFIKDNYIIRLGQFDSENTALVSKSTNNDIWFHLKSFPSPHLILSCSNDESIKTLSGDMVKHCAELVKSHSKMKKAKDIYVIFTKVSNIKLTNKPGQIIIKSMSKIKKIKI